MNEKTEQNEVITDLDSSFFTAYAAKMAAENKKSSSSSFTPREYEEVAYAGIVKRWHQLRCTQSNK